MIIHNQAPYEYSFPKTGTGLDGVVKVSADGHFGTGSLLYDGRVILTAAHVLLDDNNLTPNRATVYFETSDGKRNLTSSNLIIHPDYDAQTGSFDLALVILPQQAPLQADRYTLYRQHDESMHIATLVGYGRQGNGLTGYNDSDDQIRTQAENRLELTGSQMTELLGRPLLWEPDEESLLIADFDSGSPLHDTFAELGGDKDPGQGIYEGLIVQGDSGGPAFINQQIAGIASYITRFEQPETDIDLELNSSYGEIGFWQRVSYFEQWIDQSLRAEYDTTDSISPDTGLPDKSRIPTTVDEKDSGSQQIYFCLQFHGQREDNSSILSVDYQTRDGTATAGEDYIATSGTLKLYPGETFAWIPVEVIGDTQREGDETFYLSVSNPVGGSFANGQTELLAIRTITGDDGGLL